MKSILLAALLVSGAVRAETSDAKLTFSLGGGLAYDLLGFQLGYRSGPAEGYVGLGVLSVALPGAAAGARYFFSGDRAGSFVALNLAWHTGTIQTGDPGPNDYVATGGRLMWATITPGFRAQWGWFFLQGAFGAGVAYSRTFYRAPSQPGGPPPPKYGFDLVPDLMLAIGLRLY